MQIFSENEEKIIVAKNKKGHDVMLYYGPRVIKSGLTRKKDGKVIKKRKKSCYEGTRTIANFVSDSMLHEALEKVRDNYVGIFKESALMDFYRRVESLVNKVYSGSTEALEFVKTHQDLGLDNVDLFVMAVHALNFHGKKFPSLENENGFNPETLRILRGDFDESRVDIFPKVKALVSKVYRPGKTTVRETFCKNKRRKTVKKTVDFGVQTVEYLARFQRMLVVAYEPLFAKAVAIAKADPKKEFPSLESENDFDPEVLRILRG